jgi:hypothetical protein
LAGIFDYHGSRKPFPGSGPIRKCALKETRKCALHGCSEEFRPKRKAQEYCSPKCRREAAYGRERFQAGTSGKRRRLLRPREASETRPCIVIPGTSRKGHISSTKPISYSGGISSIWAAERRINRDFTKSAPHYGVGGSKYLRRITDDGLFFDPELDEYTYL